MCRGEGEAAAKGLSTVVVAVHLEIHIIADAMTLVSALTLFNVHSAGASPLMIMS